MSTYKPFLKTIVFAIAVTLVLSVASDAFAKSAEKIKEAVDNTFRPAPQDSSFQNAHEEFKKDLIACYAVVLKGGIPMARARIFFEWQEYDYRGAIIHVDDGEKITTRRGSVYGYLQPGDIVAVVDWKAFNNAIYLRLITPEVYAPEGRKPDEKHSRVTVMLGFKFDKKVFKDDDADAVISAMKGWLAPFYNYDDAKAYALGLAKGDAAKIAADEEKTAPKKDSKAAVKKERVPSEKERLEALEDKINKAKKEMEEAEKEMKELKQEQKGVQR